LFIAQEKLKGDEQPFCQTGEEIGILGKSREEMYPDDAKKGRVIHTYIKSNVARFLA
jgi:hypothetical protein